MDRRRGRNIRSLAAHLHDWLRRQNLWRNRNRRSGRRITNTRMRRHRRVPVMEGKIGQRYLGQDQDGGEQGQFENQDRITASAS